MSDGVKCGGEQTVRVVVTAPTWDKVALKIRPRDDVQARGRLRRPERSAKSIPTKDFIDQLRHATGHRQGRRPLPAIAAFRLLAAKLKRLGRNNPILLKDCLQFRGRAAGAEDCSLARRGGHRLAAGRRHRRRDSGSRRSRRRPSLRLAYNILQAAGCRSFKTDYVACPSCGRTLFNLQTVTARIKARTQHLKGVKIAIMGCIVNGPGEMADADFGYVGGAPGKINLYVGKTPVKFNIPEAEAVDRLVDLIREHGKWVEPELAK